MSYIDGRTLVSTALAAGAGPTGEKKKQARRYSQHTDAISFDVWLVHIEEEDVLGFANVA